MTTLLMETADDLRERLRAQVANGAYAVPETQLAEAILERLAARRQAAIGG